MIILTTQERPCGKRANITYFAWIRMLEEWAFQNLANIISGSSPLALRSGVRMREPESDPL
jgi:hypothetical protein